MIKPRQSNRLLTKFGFRMSLIVYLGLSIFKRLADDGLFFSKIDDEHIFNIQITFDIDIISK